MKTLLKVVLFGAVLLWILGWAFDNTIKNVNASELEFGFHNPAFSGWIWHSRLGWLITTSKKRYKR